MRFDLDTVGVKGAISVERVRRVLIQCVPVDGTPSSAVVEVKRAFGPDSPSASFPSTVTLELDGSSITSLDVTDTAWIHFVCTTAQSGVRVNVEFETAGSVNGSVVETVYDLTDTGPRGVVDVSGRYRAFLMLDPRESNSAVLEIKRRIGMGTDAISFASSIEPSIDNTTITEIDTDESGFLVPVCTTAQSEQRVTAYWYLRGEAMGDLQKNFILEAAAGRVNGYEVNRKFGRNTDIDTGTVPEDLWGGGGLYTGTPTSAETIEVFSDDANDTSAGSGARTIQLVGLDANWEPQTETLTLNGTTPVTTSGTWLRCNRQRVITAGSSNANEGTITVRHTTTTANVFSQLQPGKSQSTILHYTVPAGKVGLFSDLNIVVERESNNGSSASFEVKIRDNANGGVVRTILYGYAERGTPYKQKATFTEPLPEKYDIWVQINYVSANDTVVSGDFGFMLVPA